MHARKVMKQYQPDLVGITVLQFAVPVPVVYVTKTNMVEVSRSDVTVNKPPLSTQWDIDKKFKSISVVTGMVRKKVNLVANPKVTRS